MELKFYSITKKVWLLLAVVLFSSGGLYAQLTFSNAAPITINATGNATPYPSGIAVAGFSGPLTNITVTISDLSHTWPVDIDMVLVSPQGTPIILMSDAVGGSGGVTNRTYTFDMAAPTTLPLTGFPASGTYKPGSDGGSDTWPAPGPGTLTQANASLGTFNGQDPNGTWNLYIVDDAAGDLGVINGGWSITVTAPTGPCAAPLVGGTATPSAATICPSVNLSIGVTGASTGSGITYQWQSSPDGLIWSDIAGATGFSYNGLQSVATNYRRRLICNAGPDTAYSNAVSVASTPFLNCYCMNSNATSTVDEDIQNVTFAGINNTSPTLCNTYTDYTSIVGLAFQGLNYPISVNTADCEGANFYTRRVSVWIDWNQNGSFNDVGELVFDPGSLPGLATQLFSGNVTIPNTATPGITRMRVVCVETAAALTPCGTYTWGETEDYFLNVLPPPADEAGVLAITKPGIAACTLGNQLWVNMQNLGSNPLTSATFVVKVNGLNIPTTPWSGTVAPQSIAEVQVPVNYTLADGDSVYIEVSMPNGVAENPLLNFNNITARRVYAGLSGAKSVYGVGADYSDIPDALADLYLRGVCDTVYFQITEDTLNTQHTFLSYPGAGAGRLAVFESQSGNASDVNFIFTPTGTPDNFIFKFDGGDGYMLRNLTAQAIGTSFATIVDIRNGANDISFEGNTFVGDTVGTNVVGDFNRVVIASIQATTDHRTAFRNNNIIGGTRAIILAAGAGAFEEGHVFENNNITENTAMGMLLGSVSYPVLKGNTFSNRANVTGEAYNAIINVSIDGAMVDGNTMSTVRNGSNLYLINAKGGASEFMITNNFITSQDSAGLSRAVLIENVSSSGIVLANNSISYRNYNAAGGAVTILDGSQIRLFNNNVGAFGTAPAARIEKSYSVSASDNNNLFGTNLVYGVGTIHTTLASLQAASGMDANSVSVTPGFNGTDLHTCTPELNGAGMPLAFVGWDIDGDVRGTMPDIGADEFLGDANNLLVEDAFLKCPADQVTIGNTALDGVVYTWTPSGNTSEITTTNAGTFVITATSSCGSFSDTATVVNKPLPTASFTSFTVSLAAAFDNNSTNGTSYLWDFGDGNTSTDENPTHIYSSAGTYSVTLTVTNDCGTATFGPTPINVINAGIEENTNINVSLFPNPTNGQFTVTMSAVNGDAITISVIDVTGKTVMVKNIAAGVNQATLDATSFSSGVYSVKISNGNFTKVIRLVRK